MTRLLQQWSQRLDTDRFASGMLLLAIAVLACLMPAQSDTWWQLRTGEAMWASHQIMTRDEFTHTVAGGYWPNHEWLTQVIFYGAYRVGGMPLVTALCAAAVVAAWCLIALLTPGPTTVRLLLIGCGAAFTTAGWSLRPQTLSLALFAATLWMLVRRRFLWVLPPMFLLWANLHGAVATGGLLLVVAAGMSLFVARDQFLKLLFIGFLCFIATTTTPLGFSFWTEIPESLQRLKAYEVIEWRAPSLTNPADFPFWIMVGGLAVLIWQRRGSLRNWEPLFLTVASALTLVLALRSTRNFGTFILCAVPTAGVLLANSGPQTASTLVESRTRPLVFVASALISVAFITYAWWLPLPRLAWNPMSETMKNAIAACDGPLYNRYDEGGYIIWFLKGRPVFMDSRQDPFPEEMVLDQIRLEATGDYEQTFRRHAIACALTPENSVLARNLNENGWRRSPAGPGWSVYSAPGVKDPESTPGQ